MANLQAHEQVLTGRWVTENGGVRGDAVCDRIDWLLTHHLRKILDHPRGGGWETLYLDPDDGRYWERNYPQGGTPGAGLRS